jgi:hypothetical protein
MFFKHADIGPIGKISTKRFREVKKTNSVFFMFLLSASFSCRSFCFIWVMRKQPQWSGTYSEGLTVPLTRKLLSKKKKKEENSGSG